MTRHLPRLFAAGLVVAAGSLATAQEPPVRYDGHRAVRVTVRSAKELLAVHALADDILTCEGSGVGTFDARFSPEHYSALVASGISHRVLLPDIQGHIDQIWADDARIRREQQHQDDPSWFETYRSFAEIQARMQTLAATYPALATLSTIGTSIENRPIHMMRITGPGATTTRPAFVIQANQHAREWITPLCAMYIVDRLLETYDTDPRVRNLVDHLDFYIMPCVNPDGYEYSRITNSQWRKNRRDIVSSSCFGIDLNRNWGYQWGYDNSGSSGSACSDTYRGTGPFSEPELAGPKSICDMLFAQGRLKVVWDVHSNGQAILSPWGFRTSPPPPDLPQMNTLGAIIQTGMRSVRNTLYPYGQGSVILYLANGVTRDYTYAVDGAMSWTIEMDGASFQPPVSEILPLVQECLAGLLPLADFYVAQIPTCYPNCDGSTAPPFLNVNDFICFQGRFAASESYADCDQNSALNVNDFICFQNRFAAGCN